MATMANQGQSVTDLPPNASELEYRKTHYLIEFTTQFPSSEGEYTVEGNVDVTVISPEQITQPVPVVFLHGDHGTSQVSMSASWLIILERFPNASFCW